MNRVAKFRYGGLPRVAYLPITGLVIIALSIYTWREFFLHGIRQPVYTWPCKALSRREREEIFKEAASYEESDRFLRKIDEAKGLKDFDSRGLSCIEFLKQNILTAGQSVLDLGSAAGAALRHIKSILDAFGGHGRMVGVDIVPGWIKAGSEIFEDIEFYLSDITAFRKIEYNFDLIMLNDVLEHVQPSRLGCLMQTLAHFSHEKTVVYMHVPTPETQLKDTGQYYENVVPIHVITLAMSQVNFQLVHFSYDNSTVCGAKRIEKLGGKVYQCVFNGAPKYYHALFIRSADTRVFNYGS
ncbi:hypothetical protein M9434_002474 [Picochlorum sp. BPE23]|nr:hypothetical protein M9434_002474 [Picochlorum sp. BPE23]